MLVAQLYAGVYRRVGDDPAGVRLVTVLQNFVRGAEAGSNRLEVVFRSQHIGEAMRPFEA